MEQVLNCAEAVTVTNARAETTSLIRLFRAHVTHMGLATRQINGIFTIIITGLSQAYIQGGSGGNPEVRGGLKGGPTCGPSLGGSQGGSYVEPR